MRFVHVFGQLSNVSASKWGNEGVNIRMSAKLQFVGNITMYSKSSALTQVPKDVKRHISCAALPVCKCGDNSKKKCTQFDLNQVESLNRHSELQNSQLIGADAPSYLAGTGTVPL